MISTSVIARSLKRTLDKIVTDDSDGYESKALFKKWCEIDEMEDNYHDDLEVGGPGLASETPEATEFGTGDIKEGYLTRYMARKFGLKLVVTQEALDDGKYDKVIMAAKRLKRALWKTADIDATNMLIRATSSSYVGGDGVALASASHTLPLGGTFSNTMATPMSPSRQAITIATTMMRKFPGHDGVTEGVEPVAVLHPLDQWSVWEEILRSTHAPEAGEFNRINVVNSSLDIKPIPLKYWNNTTTKFAIQTDCDYGLCFKWRKRPSSNTWKENGQELTLYSISARWSRGWSDPRCLVFSDA
jgi:hypothetical protein